jgi:hypothetical protein
MAVQKDGQNGKARHCSPDRHAPCVPTDACWLLLRALLIAAAPACRSILHALPCLETRSRRDMRVCLSVCLQDGLST